MSNFAKNIGEKRTPVTTPAHIVENGVAHYGTFSEPFQDLNLLILLLRWKVNQLHCMF